MAKRKRRAGGGSKLRPIKNYQDDEYVFYIQQIETGILLAWAVNEDLRDGDVRQTLRGLIKQADKIAADLTTSSQEEAVEEVQKLKVDNSSKNALLGTFIINNLGTAYQKFGPLKGEDLAGVLRVVNHSIGAWNRGMRGQEYLKYIRGFLGQMGVAPRLLSEEEVENLEFSRPENVVEGDYDEIE